MGIERENSIDLKKEAEIPCFRPKIQTQQEPYTDEDLIDRQIEADCPGLYARHRWAAGYDDFAITSTSPCDIWKVEGSGELLHTERTLSFDKLAYQPFHTAEDEDRSFHQEEGRHYRSQPGH
jgi:hypothetical protein